MDDIKPDEAFVKSVIENAKKRKPPVYARYTKYAAAIAAAVVVVSGTVISMPLWQKVTKDTDGVIIEETITETAAPDRADNAAASLATPAPAAATAKPQTAAPAKTAAPSVTTVPARSDSKPQTASSYRSSAGGTQSSGGSQGSVSSQSSGTSERVEPPSLTEPPQLKNSSPVPAQSEAMAEDQNSDAGAAAGSDDVPMLKSSVLGDTDEETKENTMPSDMSAYEEKTDAAKVYSASQAAISDSDIPTPSGYYCTSASPRGYTFVNDDGAVITVAINYGGEEREPYIEENGDNIYAVFTSYGLSVTINSSGADRSAVEEIINSLR